jgi:hypothetical protein
MWRVTEIIDRVFEAGLYNYLISLHIHWVKLRTRMIAIVHPLDGFSKLSLYHMQSPGFLLLLAWCLRAICFMFEVLCSGVFGKRK